jgi:hypothetical protein
MDGMNTQFWDARPALAYIRDFARATRIGPDALLASVLCRVSTATPPEIVIPPLVGSSPGSLNFDVAVVGGPGAGKGLAEGGARTLMADIRGAVTTQPASGEGLAALFAARVPVSEEEGGSRGETRITCTSLRALLSLPEIGVLGGVSSRTGSTVVPTLCSAWSGESLGAFNKAEANRLTVPAHAYRLSMIVGVQPAASTALFAHADVGLPQRFLWVSATDHQAPEHSPALPSASFPLTESMLPADPERASLSAAYQCGTIHNDLHYKLVYMDYPPVAYAEADRQRLGVLHGAELPPLDAHLIQLKAKVAGLLALMDGGRLTVNAQDWELAGSITDRSCRVRDMCLEQMHEAKQHARADWMADDDAAKQLADSKRMDSARRSIVNYLRRHDQAREGVKGYLLRRPLGRGGAIAYDAIESLYEDGSLDRLDSDETTSSARWALSMER